MRMQLKTFLCLLMVSWLADGISTEFRKTGSGYDLEERRFLSVLKDSNKLIKSDDSSHRFLNDEETVLTPSNEESTQNVDDKTENSLPTEGESDQTTEDKTNETENLEKEDSNDDTVTGEEEKIDQGEINDGESSD